MTLAEWTHTSTHTQGNTNPDILHLWNVGNVRFHNLDIQAHIYGAFNPGNHSGRNPSQGVCFQDTLRNARTIVAVNVSVRHSEIRTNYIIVIINIPIHLEQKYVCTEHRAVLKRPRSLVSINSCIILY